MMTEQLLNDNEFSLLRLLPTVLRARDFRLYTKDRKRLVDLWQNGGAAILGHTPSGFLREIKNAASRGLYAPFPHFLEGRYFKALSRIFTNRNFRLYAAPPQELHALVAENTAALWRPFIDSAAPLAVDENAPPILIPVVPGIQGWHNGLPLGLCVLAINPDYEKILPPGDFVSPVLLAAAARGLYDLIAPAPERMKKGAIEFHVYPRIARALKADQQGKKFWHLSFPLSNPVTGRMGRAIPPFP